MTYFMGIDTSTTATKALLIDETGQVAAVASSEYSYETPHLLWSEQDPRLWWEAGLMSIQKGLAVAGVGGEDVKGDWHDRSNARAGAVGCQR